MKERPILFSAPMVRALLAGTKTQTRRVAKHPVFETLSYVVDCGDGWWGDEEGEAQVRCPYGAPGDRLWVRETWADTNGENGPMISYRACGDRFLVDESYPVDYSLYPGCHFSMWCGDLRRGVEGHAWRSPIHMPRWASRITLEITDVRVQRLQDISEEDANAEGALDPPFASRRHLAIEAFHALWDSINAKRCPWALNPWVWALSFRSIEQ